MNVSDALRSICTTGEGFCSYCDDKLPLVADAAIDSGWDVKRLDGERAGSIILICPECRREKRELGEEGFLHKLMLRVCNSICCGDF